MTLYKILAFTLLFFFLSNCGKTSGTDTDLFSLEIKNPKKNYIPADELSFSVNNKKGADIDSIVYFLNEKRLAVSKNNTETKQELRDQKLGNQILTAKIYSDGDVFEASQNILILSGIKPTLYTYKILETYPHDIHAYTQGLEFKNDTLYESTGTYGESTLRKTDYKTGQVLKNIPLSKEYFAEGLTIVNEKIYQLTWRENIGFIYNLHTLEQTGTFVYGKSKEGWGLCNNGETIFKSDGTEKIWSLNPNNLAETGHIEIYTNTSKINSVNELEWVDGKIYANIFTQGSIAIINPANGAVEGVIDMTDLKDKVAQHPKLDVLNGIAYKGEPGILYITGKNWDKLFKVEIVEK